MKNVLLILGVILFTSCVEPLENYKGCIIAKKYLLIDKVMLKELDTINCKYRYIKVFALESEINSYQVGDTIK